MEYQVKPYEATGIELSLSETDLRIARQFPEQAMLQILSHVEKVLALPEPSTNGNGSGHKPVTRATGRISKRVECGICHLWFKKAGIKTHQNACRRKHPEVRARQTAMLMLPAPQPDGNGAKAKR